MPLTRFIVIRVSSLLRAVEIVIVNRLIGCLAEATVLTKHLVLCRTVDVDYVGGLRVVRVLTRKPKNGLLPAGLSTVGRVSEDDVNVRYRGLDGEHRKVLVSIDGTKTNLKELSSRC